MRTQVTTQELSEMDDQAFLAHCQAFPQGSQWIHADAFRYAATRLARLQGLMITKQ